MAAEIEKAFPGTMIKMVPSSGGVFEVTADGELVFSKKALKRHAEPGEVLRTLMARQSRS